MSPHAHLHLQHRPLQPRPLPRGVRQEVAVDRHRRHQGPLRESQGRHTAVPGSTSAIGAKGRGGAPHPRQGAGAGLPRGFRQVSRPVRPTGAGALSTDALQDAGLRLSGGLYRQR